MNHQHVLSCNLLIKQMQFLFSFDIVNYSNGGLVHGFFGAFVILSELFLQHFLNSVPFSIWLLDVRNALHQSLDAVIFLQMLVFDLQKLLYYLQRRRKFFAIEAIFGRWEVNEASLVYPSCHLGICSDYLIICRHLLRTFVLKGLCIILICKFLFHYFYVNCFYLFWIN